MPAFFYRALDADGRAQRGVVEARDEPAALALLQGRALLVLRLDTRRPWLWRPATPFTAADLAHLTGQLTTLIDAGQPLEKALAMAARQSGAPRRRALLERVRERVKAGEPLSRALEQEQPVFSPFYVSLVRAGEASGALAQTLAQLASHLERAQRLRGEVVNALIYPAFLVAGVLGSVALLLAYVVPQFVPIFRDLGVPLPAITEVILALGAFTNAYGLLLLGTALAGVWLFALGRRSASRRLAQDLRLLRLRLIGPLLQRLETARLARTLGTLLCNDVALLPALAIVRHVNANAALRAHVQTIAERLNNGGSLTAALDPALIPELAVQMIEVGEHSGQLGPMLLKVADVFEVEAKRTIDRLLAALIPTLTIVMAVMVAVIMLAIMLPLMSLTSNI